MHQISHWKRFILLLAAAGSALLLASCGTTKGTAKVIGEVFGPEDNPDEADLSLLRQDKSLVLKQPQRALPRLPGEKGVQLELSEGKEAVSYEYLFRSPKALPEFRRAELTLSVLLPAGDEGKELSALLVDQEGEIFQIPERLPHGDGAWHELVFSVDADTLGEMSREGKTANRKVDPPLRLAGIAGDSQSIGLGVMRCRVLDSNAPLALELLTGSGSDIHVLKKGEEESLELLLRNPRPLKPLSGVLKWSLTGVRGEPLAEKEEKVSLAPGEEKRLPLPEPATFGVYKLRMEVTDDDPSVPKFQKEMSYAYLVPAGPTKGRDDGFVFGIAGHPLRYSIAEMRKMAMAASWCGAKALRDDIHWYFLQPTKDTWNFLNVDRVVKIFGEYGVRLMPIYSFCAPWAVAKDWRPMNPKIRGHQRPDYDSWRKFVGAFASRYRDQVRYAEIWNEPDLYVFANFSAQEYVRMIEIAYEEIKKAAPEWQVLTGGFACLPGGAGSAGNPAVMPAVIRSGKYDIFAFHGHGPFGLYRVLLQQLPSWGNRKPWFANETALSSTVYGEEVQAQTLFRKLIWSWAKGAVGYNWYNLREKGYDPANPEHHYGMLTMDFYPKPVYAAYNALSTLYRGGTFLREVKIDQNLGACWFRGRDGALLLAAWSDARDQQVWPLGVSGITGKAEIVDLYGNVKPLAVQNGAVTFEVGPEPATLRVTGQTGDPGAVGLSAHPVDRLEILPGGEAVFAFELFNPENQAKECNVRLELPAGLSAKGNSETFQLAPGETKKVSFPVRAEADFRSFSGRQKELTLVFNGQSFRYWIDSIVPLPAKGYRSEPDFVLNTAGQVQILVPYAPGSESLYWKGPQDLSAKVWFGRDGDTLLLKAEVTDDQHVQPYSGDAAHNGDNIQVSLNLPEQPRDWEIRLTRLASGKGEAYVRFAPQTFSQEAATAQLSLETSRDDKTGLTVYEARIPFKAIGLTEKAEKAGFRFNLLVNDNDGSGRESFLALTTVINEYTGHEPWVTF